MLRRGPTKTCLHDPVPVDFLGTFISPDSSESISNLVNLQKVF